MKPVKNPQKPKPVYGYAISVCWRNHDNYDKKTEIGTWWGIYEKRQEAIDNYEQKCRESWKKCYREGDRCIRVLISPA